MSDVRSLFKGRVLDVRIETVRLPGGATVDLEMVRHPGAAAVVPLHADGTVTLVRQFRHAAGGFLWEIPAGKLDPGETPAHCAARELREEVGLCASELSHLGSILTTPGFCDERIHLFLARGLGEAPAALEFDEVLTVHRLPLPRTLEMIAGGEIDDAKTLAGLHHASRYLRRGL